MTSWTLYGHLNDITHITWEIDGEKVKLSLFSSVQFIVHNLKQLEKCDQPKCYLKLKKTVY